MHEEVPGFHGAPGTDRMDAALEPAAKDGTRASLSRRSLLKAVLVIPTAGMLGCHAREPQRSSERSSAPAVTSVPAFFTTAERTFVDAATGRLIPDENDGLGARGAAVGEFLDRQLAGPYGRAERWYMQGPWQNGVPQQGYQLKLTPGELYKTAIRDVNAWCQKQHGKEFAALTPSVQDEVLGGLESGDIVLADVPSKVFFTMLWSNTVEGFLSDPIYGGNRNFAGWKLVGFPGPRYNYVAEIEQYGKPYTEPTVGLLGRDPARLARG